MKKVFLAFTAALFSILPASAANVVTVSDVTLTKGRTGTISVAMENDKPYTAFQMKLNLPQGITLVSVTKGARMDESHGLSCQPATGMIACLSTVNALFTGNSGELFTITVSVSDDAELNTPLSASLTGVVLSTTSGFDNLSDAPFTITVTEPIYTVLDENATTVPASSGGEAVSIRVLRTIKAGEWSTICLPFAMTEAETKRVFGNDVQLFSFTDYEATFDEVTDECTNITVNFEDADLASWGFEANIPYLIKVSSPITQFETTAVIEPDEAGAIVEFDNGRTGSRRVVYGTFYGTLRAGTKVPANCLFIGNDKFYYSTGKTNIKAFRGYFEFDDILTVVEGGSGVKMNFNAADEATGIGEIKNETLKINNDVPVYDLTGRRVGRTKDESNSDSSFGGEADILHSSFLSPGIYIVGGKKVFKNQ